MGSYHDGGGGLLNGQNFFRLMNQSTSTKASFVRVKWIWENIKITVLPPSVFKKTLILIDEQNKTLHKTKQQQRQW